MKFVKTALLALILGTSAANAADVNNAKELLASSIEENNGLGDVNNTLRIDLLKGEAAITELKTENLKVTKIDFDKTAGFFKAYISANDNLPFEVAGRFSEITKIPVLAKKLGKNEIITKDNITYLEIESSKLKNGYITDEAMLIGKSPTRAIYQARPIVGSQISAPKVIERNKQITMIFKNNALRIEDVGIALEDGSLGEVIKLRNATSKRIVRAKIVDAQTAEIQSIGTSLASN